MTKILIVEDEQIISLDLKQGLEIEGYGIVGVVDNAHEALKIAQEKRPDLVLMDIMINGDMDGIEAGNQLRQMGIPVIYLTAYGDPQTVLRAAESLPYGFITKPYRRRELIASIEIALYRSKAERQLSALQQDLAADPAEQVRHILGKTASTPVRSNLQGGHESSDASLPHESLSLRARIINILLGQTQHQPPHPLHPPASFVDLIPLTQMVIESFEKKQQVRIKLELKVNSAFVVATSELMWHLLKNLIGNALKYTSADSLITITIDKSKNDRVTRWAITDDAQTPSVFQSMKPSQSRSNNVERASDSELTLYLLKYLSANFGGQFTYQQHANAVSFLEFALP